MQPVILPHVNELVALLACFTCFIGVVAVRMGLAVRFEDCLFRVREYVVEFDSQVVVRHDDIQFFGRGKNCAVITEDCATRDKRLYHFGEAYLVSLGGFWVWGGVCGCKIIDTRDDDST